MTDIGHLINGEIKETCTRKQAVYNPATGELAKDVLLAPVEFVDEAVAIADAAYPEWRNTPAIKRARIMFRYKQLLEDNKETICRVIGRIRF